MPTPLIADKTLEQLQGDRLITGDGRNVTAIFSSSQNLIGAAVRFTLSVRAGVGWQHLLTLTRAGGGVVITSESAGQLAIAFQIAGSVTGSLNLPGIGATAQYDIEVSPVDGLPITVQGQFMIVPSTPTASTGSIPQSVLDLHLSDSDPHPQYTQPSEIDALIQAAVQDAAPAYETTFTQASLSIAGVLAVVHNLDPSPSGVAVWDSLGEVVAPDAIAFVNSAAIAIDLASYQPLQGTWKVSVTI